MTIVPFKDIRPGDVFTVTYQWAGIAFRTTYCMEEDGQIYLYPSTTANFPAALLWSSPLQECERRCPGAL